MHRLFCQGIELGPVQQLARALTARTDFIHFISEHLSLLSAINQQLYRWAAIPSSTTIGRLSQQKICIFKISRLDVQLL
jgi:hypothetical protein